jgi:hypothetical protein
MYEAPETELSFVTPASDQLELTYTFNSHMAVDHYHALVVKAQLSRHIPALMDDIVDEVGAAFEDEIIMTDGTI